MMASLEPSSSSAAAFNEIYFSNSEIIKLQERFLHLDKRKSGCLTKRDLESLPGKNMEF